jgi:peroxiredoxin
VESHQRFAEREGSFPFPLLSDPDLTVARLYEVVSEDGRKARRAVFVIDQNGDILRALPYYNPANSEQFLEIFEALGFSL